MRRSVSLTADALATSLGEALVSLPREQFPQLVPFVPDTPWTTGALHVLHRQQGRVFVDSETEPRVVVVIAQGDPVTRTVDQAFVLGAPDAEGLSLFLQAIRAPMELVCDDDVAKLVQELHPEARRRESVVHWYERLEDADRVRSEPGARRLRISEAEQIATLVPGWCMRTFRSPRDLVSGGTVYVTEADGRIASAGFSVDQSAKYERVCAATWEALRGKGHGGRVAAKVLRAVADQGRIPCAVVDVNDAAGLRIAENLGFNRRALMTMWITSFRK